MLQATPTANQTLPFKSEGFATLTQGLDYAATGETGFNFFSARGDLEVALPYRELRAQALDLAPRFRTAGLERGDRVAVIAETTPAFLTVFFACQYAGLVPVPLPLCINFGGKDAYVARLQGMLLSAGARAAIAADELVGTLEEAALETDVRFVGTIDDLAGLKPTGSLVRLRPEDPCYIQYSSGSTSFPRGVLVTQAAITANARAIARGIELHAGDRCTSWLPLYHDMGLVGCCLTPVLNQIPVDYIATTGFARRPLSWLKVLSDMGGTISFSPTFGYELCARRASNGAGGPYDLSSWRVAGIGGEMIRPKALREFAETFKTQGFDERAFVASYGLAEATLAVTFAPLNQGIAVDRIEQGDAFERLRLAIPADATAQLEGRRTRSFVKCGRPMEGYALEIRDDANRRLPERTVGRVCIKGPSLMTGYFRNVEATNAVMVEDGWLDTGDMGYMIDGELVVTGRTKDLIILNGRNIWPQDLEWAIERIEGVRVGDVAAFSVTGDEERERVVAVVQCRTSEIESQDRLRADIHATLQRVAGVPCEVVLAPPRSLTFTTSGKLSRAAAKAKYASGSIRDIAGPVVAPAANQSWAQLALAS